MWPVITTAACTTPLTLQDHNILFAPSQPPKTISPSWPQAQKDNHFALMAMATLRKALNVWICARLSRVWLIMYTFFLPEIHYNLIKVEAMSSSIKNQILKFLAAPLILLWFPETCLNFRSRYLTEGIRIPRVLFSWPHLALQSL